MPMSWKNSTDSLKGDFNKNKGSWIWAIIGVFIILSAVDSNLTPLIIFIVMAVGGFYLYKNIKEKATDQPQVRVVDGDAGLGENVNNITNKILNYKSMRKSFWIIFVLVVVVILISLSIVVIPAGKTGVYHLFGKVKDKELRSGIHLINPLARVTEMSVRTEEYTMSILQDEGKKAGSDTIAALTKEGLSVDLDITVLYHLDEEQASDIFKNIGVGYEEKIIRPQIRSAIREVVALYEVKDIYSEKRQETAQGILETLKSSVEERGIVIEDVLLRNVALPPKLTASIQEKLSAEQEAQRYDFVLQREEKEKQRKIIEAEGQKEAQTIINQSLSNKYIHYLYIQQLKDLEGTIYIPTSPDTGLPLFRGVQ